MAQASYDLDYLVNHIILPPKLPQEEDNSTSRELSLLRFIRDEARLFCKHSAGQSYNVWLGVVKTLSVWVDTVDCGSVSAANLSQALANMCEEGE